MKDLKTLYLTTPLYYVNAAPHIGHAYTTLASDILSRYHRLKGRTVRLLTGTDEHGSKIEEAAQGAGTSPKQYADQVSAEFSSLWKHLDVRYDDFIRTTDDRHTRRVQAVFEHLLSTGDIEKGVYRGYYCVACETYWTETEAPPDADGGPRRCPNEGCGRELKLTEEESYFFKLSKYQEPLLAHFSAHPEFMRPRSRATEIVNFVKEGLRDLAVSRTKVSWGISVPGDPGHVVYVWFDALLNYLNATGYHPPGMAQNGTDLSKDLWPADVHFVGKEIFRFHAVIWPAILMALKLPLPKCVYAHGWWTVDGQKMSKSKGNFIDPRSITREFGVDAFRYFLFREMPFGNDGDFSLEKMQQRYNAELANDLGNLVSRLTNMVDKYLAGALPGKPPLDKLSLTPSVLAAGAVVEVAMDEIRLQDALNAIWAEIGKLNLFIDQKKPWQMVKTDPEGVRWALYDLVCSMRVIAGWLSPFMPETATKIQTSLGVRRPSPALSAEEVLGGPSGDKILKAPPLFPRKE